MDRLLQLAWTAPGLMDRLLQTHFWRAEEQTETNLCARHVNLCTHVQNLCARRVRMSHLVQRSGDLMSCEVHMSTLSDPKGLL